MIINRIDAWLLWVVYRAGIHSNDQTYADGVTDAKFIDIKELESSDDMFVQAVVEVDRTLTQTN